MKPPRKQKIIKTVALFAVLSFFFPSHFVGAFDIWSWLGMPSGTDVLVYLFQGMFNIIGGLTAIAAKALNFSVFVKPGGNLLIVETTWKILRDFANMFFIIALIYMAFATIFDQGKYTFKDMIFRFVIVAVFINFSLVIGGLIIDACQVLTNIFLGSIGNLGDRLGTYLNPSLLMPGVTDLNGADIGIGGLISLVFAVILSLIFLFSLTVALVFAVIRVPIIWALLIVSPIAWMSNILPNSPNSWWAWNRWWKEFWGWNLFLPVYLFFMYLGLLFLSQRDVIIGVVIQANANDTTNPANQALLDGITNSLSFNLVFFYAFAAFIMVGSIWAAKSITSMAGGSFANGVDRARGWVKSRPLPYVGSLDASEKAYAARKKQFQQSGFKNPWLNKVYGGADAQARANARASKLFGVGVSNSQAQKDFVASVKKSHDEIEEKYDTGQLDIQGLRNKVATTRADSAEGYAYRRFALKKGVLDGAEFKNTLSTLKNNPYAVQDITKAAQDAKFSGINNVTATALDGTLNSPSLVAARRNMLMHVSGDAKSAASFTPANLQDAMALLGNWDSPEAKKFFKNISKFRPDLTIDYHLNPTNGTGNTKTADVLWNEAMNTDAKELVNMPLVVWGRPEFHAAIARKLGPVAAGRSSAQTKLRNRFLTLFLNDPHGAAKQAILTTHVP